MESEVSDSKSNETDDLDKHQLPQTTIQIGQEHIRGIRHEGMYYSNVKA